MKHSLSILFFMFLFTYASGQRSPQKAYSIKGKIQNWNGRLIYFSCIGSGIGRIWDSTIVQDNAFTFTGTLKEPANGFITIRKSDRVSNLEDKNITGRLFIGPFRMSISLEVGNFHEGRLIGSKYADQYYVLEKSKKKIYDNIRSLNDFNDSLNETYIKAQLENDETKKDSLAHKMDSLNIILDTFWNECAKIDKAFFIQYPNSYTSSYLLQNYFAKFSLRELKHHYKRLLPSVKKWEYSIKLKEAIDALQNGSPGNKAADFSGTDIKGDSLSLSQFRGKYVLLDFWASWCKPCRAGNPELIRLYKKYRDKGIEFIGLANDQGHEDKWKAAVEKDKIGIWRHILDTNIGDSYAVHFIPLQILINPEGIIIARFGDDAEPNENIARTLEKIFGK